MVTERHYSAACLLLSEPHRAGMEQNYTEPASDLSVAGFIDGLLRRCAPRADLGTGDAQIGLGDRRIEGRPGHGAGP